MSGFDIDDLLIDDVTRVMSERIADDAVGDADLDAIDDDADALFDEYLLDHRKVERILRRKYDAPRPVKRKGVLDAVADGDRLALRVFRWEPRHITHYVMAGTVDFDAAGDLAECRLADPTVYSWIGRYPDGWEELTETSHELGKVTPLVEVADFETPEVYVARGTASTDGPLYGPKECFGVIRDAVIDPETLDELTDDADAVSLGGGR
jgi:hypothetical protein